MVMMDWGTAVQRRASREPLERAAGRVLFTAFDAFDFLNPAAHFPLRANGDGAWFGWPDGAAGGGAARRLVRGAGPRRAAAHRAGDAGGGDGRSASTCRWAPTSSSPRCAGTSRTAWSARRCSGTSSGADRAGAAPVLGAARLASSLPPSVPGETNHDHPPSAARRRGGDARRAGAGAARRAVACCGSRRRPISAGSIPSPSPPT